MDITKTPLASKTIWGGLLSILGVALPVILKSVKLDDVIAPDDVTGLIGQIATVAGAVLAIYGRIAAKTRIA